MYAFPRGSVGTRDDMCWLNGVKSTCQFIHSTGQDNCRLTGQVNCRLTQPKDIILDKLLTHQEQLEEANQNKDIWCIEIY